MTALVPVPLDATAGRARRGSPRGSAAWRWSLLAVVVLHGALMAAWWVEARRAKPAVVLVPMQVRLDERPAPSPQDVLRKSGPVHGRTPAVTSPPKPAEPMAVMQPAVVSAVASVSPVTPKPALEVSASPLRATSPPTPTPPAPAVPATAAPMVSAAPASANPPPAEGAAGADRHAPPVDMPSASVEYLVKPVLDFPPGSEDLGEFGSVTLRVLVDEQGMVSTVQRLKSSGYARLDQHAVKVIRRARFKPNLVHGEPRAAWVTVPLNFNPP